MKEGNGFTCTLASFKLKAVKKLKCYFWTFLIKQRTFVPQFLNRNMKAKLLIVTGLVLFCALVRAQDVQSLQLDSRAYRHYTADEIKAFDAAKIEKLNYLFNESFIIPDDMKSTLKNEDVDIYGFSSFRSENERVKLPLSAITEQAGNEYIILLSYKELDEAYLIIDEKYIKQ